MGTVFSEQNVLDGNLFKYEERLQSHMNKYIENGATLTTWYQLNTKDSTVDKGFKDTDETFGSNSSLRYNKIMDFPVYNLSHGGVDNTDENGIEDINTEGELTIIPNTIIPNQGDYFSFNHLRMRAVYQITSVNMDVMKIHGHIRCKFRLIITDEERLQLLEKQVTVRLHTELDAVGSTVNPIIKEDDFTKRNQIIVMLSEMIQGYKVMFYNERHNCFLYTTNGEILFDPACHEFMMRHSLMNEKNAVSLITLTDKITDNKNPMYYAKSIYHWVELGCPQQFLNTFKFDIQSCEEYHDSSFMLWRNSEINIIRPALYDNDNKRSYFSDEQFVSLDGKFKPDNRYEQLIYDYIHNKDSMSISDIHLDTGMLLMMSNKSIDVFFYTPIIIYIIRQIMKLN